jgi:hypothetical protein
MKLTTAVVTLMMMGTGLAQNPNIINNTKNTMQQVQQQQQAASNQALGIPAKPAAATPATPAKSATTKPAVAPSKPAAAPAKAAATKPAAPKPAPASKAVATGGSASAPAKDKAEAASNSDSQSGSDAEDKKYSMTGKRDPFLSPVVSRNNGSGCSTGKKCLDIEAIAVRGVVRSDAGMIAVVTNGLNKAYFLRENDPVFNGYVVKITGDSVVFKETFQDKLGKPFTKDVVKKLTTPAV